MSDGDPGDDVIERRTPRFVDDPARPIKPDGLTLVDFPPRAPSDQEQATALRIRALEALEQLNAVCTEADLARDSSSPMRPRKTAWANTSSRNSAFSKKWADRLA
jgi:hypothetical protein